MNNVVPKSIQKINIEDYAGVDPETRESLRPHLSPMKQEEGEVLAIRRRVVLSFLAVFILGIPLWLKTTTIYRTPLPQEIATDLLADVQVREHVCAYISPTCGVSVDELQTEVGLNGPFELEFKPRTGFEDTCRYIIECVESSETRAEIKSEIAKINNRTETIHTISIRYEELNKHVVANAVRDAFLGDILFFNEDRDTVMHKGAKYSDTVHLSFTLLVANDDYYVDMAEWRDAIDAFISSLYDLHAYTTVSYDSNIEFQYISEDMNLDTPDQLSSLLDTWDLQPITLADNIQVLQFVYFVPPQASRQIKFTVPNWGGVVVAGPDSTIQSAVSAFRPQLDRLISPVSFVLDKRFVPHRHEFARIATIMNLRSTADSLSSLSRIVTSLPELAVPATVRDSVVSSLDQFHECLRVLNDFANASVSAALERSALELSSHAASFAKKALFDADMRLNMFVPFEHKASVYLPLLGPALVPLLVGLRRIYKESRL